jgi:hypothetical protein
MYISVFRILKISDLTFLSLQKFLAGLNKNALSLYLD